ncbi:unnamed protein product [Candida verbasci]|uniref:Uncharacterized protein n=1 Tax=Candida verbasci TaxID=1227364 RepID=A0A9W4U214_9ASCO|nr:unnamed protein product [Candida verbasci]
MDSISISCNELINYYTTNYNEPLIINRQEVKSKIINSLIHEPRQQQEQEQEQEQEQKSLQQGTEIDLSTIINDYWSLEERIETNVENIKDENVLKFIEEQKKHKENFLNEIKEKGSKLSKDIE